MKDMTQHTAGSRSTFPWVSVGELFWWMSECYNTTNRCPFQAEPYRTMAGASEVHVVLLI